MGDTMDPRRGSVETGRWYDIKVELKGTSVKCSLDGRVVHEIRNSLARPRGLYASASHDRQSGDVILKVVNASPTPTETEIVLAGAKQAPASARAIVLTSEQSTDENSLEQPAKVSPKTETLKLPGATWRHPFPGNSLTVLRVKTAE